MNKLINKDNEWIIHFMSNLDRLLDGFEHLTANYRPTLGGERFFTDKEVLDMSRFESLGVIKNEPVYEQELLDHFLKVVADLKAQGLWEKVDLVDLFNKMIPDFKHKETGKYLDGRM